MSAEEDFKELYQASYPKIWKLCRGFSRDAAEADDLAHEAFTAAWANWDTFRNAAKRSTWVYRIAVNICLGEIRRKGKKREVEIKADQIAHYPDVPPDQENSIELLYTCIQQLPEAERVLISLTLDGLSHQDIAEITGLRENTIAVKIHRIKKQLIKIYEQYEKLS